MTGISFESPAGTIEAARSSDLSHIQWLLNLQNLPSEDITQAALEHFLVCRDAIGVVGVVGLEYYGKVALLRSLVVADGFAGWGLGRRLVVAAEYFAQRRHVRSIYLLTTTAELFFEALGFRCIPRDCAPRAIEDSSQFKSLCPSTAVLMVKP
jgi:N-acetylglutamate synthase-like GNAT family acetyltransferase